MSKKIKLYMVDIEDSTINRLEEVFYKHPQLGIKVSGYSHNFVSCVNDMDRAKNADVFLVSAYLPDQMGIDLISKIKKIKPESKIIIMVSKNTRNLGEVAKEKGANGIIQKPFKAKELIDLIESLVDRNTLSEDDNFVETKNTDSKIPNHSPQNETKGSDLSKNFNKEEQETINQTETKRALFDVYSENNFVSSIYNDDEEENNGDKPNLVVVFASTSSSGKTTLLTNVAYDIHKKSDYKPKICIVDFNLLFPSVLYKFHQDDLIMCKRNIYDLAEDMNHLDESLINQALITHEPTGIKILNTPSDTIRDFSKIDSATIEQLIAYLRNMFDLVLIDTSSNLRDDTTSVPLTISDKSFVVIEPDLSSLLHTRKFVSMLKMFEANLDTKIISKINFILNKENPKTGIHIDTIRKTLFNSNIRIQIPEDINITHLANNGQFIIDSNYPSAKSVAELAKLVYPSKKSFTLKKNNSSKNSLFGNLFGKKK